MERICDKNCAQTRVAGADMSHPINHLGDCSFHAPELNKKTTPLPVDDGDKLLVFPPWMFGKEES